MPDDRRAWHRGGACLFIVNLLRRGLAREYGPKRNPGSLKTAQPIKSPGPHATCHMLHVTCYVSPNPNVFLSPGCMSITSVL